MYYGSPVLTPQEYLSDIKAANFQIDRRQVMLELQNTELV